jgi:hypothetical protein
MAQLGCEVWFAEQIEVPDPGAIDWFDGVVSSFGLTPRAVLFDAEGAVLTGPPAGELESVAARSDLLLNISGNLRDDRLLRLPRRRAYLDLDPGYTQIWHRDGALSDLLERHDDHLTVALNPSALPPDGLRWRAVPPPVVLGDWSVRAPVEEPRFTTVASWRGGYGRLQDGLRLYGQKAHEFRRVSDLPGLMPDGVGLEAALGIDPGDGADRARLLAGGWRLADPAAVTGDPQAFREYVRGSTGELSPAQGVYVELGCGWFSDRTTRYLASGRPAIVQATGLPPGIPTGTGLLTFGTAAEAAAAARAVMADSGAHARAARQLAEELFDSGIVIGRLLEDLIR